MNPAQELLKDIAALQKQIRPGSNPQIFSASIKSNIRKVSETYFREVHPNVTDPTLNPADIATTFEELHELSSKNPSKKKCLETLTAAKKILIRIDRSLALLRPNGSDGRMIPTDKLLISSLDDICPAASLSYRQALADLEQAERLSWRGPATDLREALRETLDILAPDQDVIAEPGYRPEKDAQRPTMKQKVRFILRNRGMNSGQIATSADAVSGVEEMIGGLTRSVYQRSSVSTHTPTTRTEVIRIQSWVRLILCELLEVPL